MHQAQRSRHQMQPNQMPHPGIGCNQRAGCPGQAACRERTRAGARPDPLTCAAGRTHSRRLQNDASDATLLICIVVTDVCRSMCGCVLPIRTPAALARFRRRRVAACRSIRNPRLLSRIGPADRRPRGRWPGRLRAAAARAQPRSPSRRLAVPGGRAPRPDRRYSRRLPRRSAAPAGRASLPARSRTASQRALDRARNRCTGPGRQPPPAPGIGSSP